jgi:hypothetical protein
MPRDPGGWRVVVCAACRKRPKAPRAGRRPAAGVAVSGREADTVADAIAATGQIEAVQSIDSGVEGAS